MCPNFNNCSLLYNYTITIESEVLMHKVKKLFEKNGIQKIEV